MNELNPVSVINEQGDSDWLLVCEHATNNVPAHMNMLGLADNFFDEHIGHDIGAYEMTLALSSALNATAIVCNYSRLVIDCNRVLKAPDCIPTTSDGIVIPANKNISDDDRMLRISQIYQPFHACIARVLADKLVHNRQTKFANIHSFTPMLAAESVRRPWHIGFIYRNPHPTLQLIDYLRSHTDYLVGDNQPYNGFVHRGYTVPAHADAQELPSFLVEFRQDLIATDAGVAHWAELLLAAMATLSDSPADELSMATYNGERHVTI